MAWRKKNIHRSNPKKRDFDRTWEEKEAPKLPYPIGGIDDPVAKERAEQKKIRGRANKTAGRKELETREPFRLPPWQA